MNTEVFYPALVGAGLVFWIIRFAYKGMGEPDGWLGTFIIVLFVASQYLLPMDYPKENHTRPGMWFTLFVDNLEALGMLLGLYFLGFITVLEDKPPQGA